MKNNLKLLVFPLIIALTFALSHAIHGMEGFSKLDNQDVKRLYILVDPNDTDITEKSQAKRRRIKERRENLFECYPEEIKRNILEQAVIDNYLINSHAAPLKLVCKGWHGIINKEFVNHAIISLYTSLGYGEICKRFLNGKLVYRSEKGRDISTIEMRISDLVNPLEGTFDLSRCGDAGKCLSISTGYRKEKKAENVNKVEIWFALRFLIEKELKTTAGHFQYIYDYWSIRAPVCIFWTWGGWNKIELYDYYIAKNFEELSNNNLYEKRLDGCQAPSTPVYPLRGLPIQQNFTFIL
jgi:hypothetical protein